MRIEIIIAFCLPSIISIISFIHGFTLAGLILTPIVYLFYKSCSKSANQKKTKDNSLEKPQEDKWEQSESDVDYEIHFTKDLTKYTYTKFSDKESKFKYCILVLLAEVMKVDSKLTTNELGSVVNTINRYYRTESEQREALQQFLTLLKITPEMSLVFVTINNSFSFSSKSELFMELLAVTHADNKYHDKEKKLIKRFAKSLNITPEQYNSIYTLFLKKYRNGNYKKKKKTENHNEEQNNSQESNVDTDYIKDACTMLGVESNASDEEIKKAYRALAIKYHPDNAASLGDEAIRQATESMKQINMAWETVKMARGIK